MKKSHLRITYPYFYAPFSAGFMKKYCQNKKRSQALRLESVICIRYDQAAPHGAAWLFSQKVGMAAGVSMNSIIFGMNGTCAVLFPALYWNQNCQTCCGKGEKCMSMESARCFCEDEE